MTDDLKDLRTKVEMFLGWSSDPLLGRTHLGLAVTLAEQAESLGDEYDTRMLAKALTAASRNAIERSDWQLADLYSAKLLAVLSDLADAGDEEQAKGVNLCVATLPVHLVLLARACSAARREAANV